MYRFIDVSGDTDEVERTANEWQAKGYELFQAVFKTTYRWVLIFKKDGE